MSTPSILNLQVTKGQVDQHSGNLAIEGANGAKSFSTELQGIVSSDGKSATGVRGVTRVSVDQKGTIKTTGVATDLALKPGRGMFIGKVEGAREGEVVMMPTASTRQDKNGVLVTEGGIKLQGWKLDKAGELPDDAALTTSLSDIVIGDLRADAEPTTEAAARFNLDSRQLVAGGGTARFNLDNAGDINNNIGGDAIIAPTAELKHGSNLRFTAQRSSGDDIVTNNFSYTYGGVFETAKFDPTNNSLVDGQGSNLATDKLEFKVGGASITVTRGAAGTYGDNDSVLKHIAAQINATTGLTAARARVVNDGTNAWLVIAPENPNNSVSFTQGSNPIAAQFGLEGKSIAAATNKEQRFTTLSQLRDYLALEESIDGDSTTTEGGQIAVKANNNYSVYVQNGSTEGNLIKALLGLENGAYFKPNYDAYNPKLNMAGGNISPHLPTQMTVFDSQGNAHQVKVSMLKLDTNKWAVEVHAGKPDEIKGRTDGLLQAGILNFDQNGSLLGIEPVIQPTYSSADIGSPSEVLGATQGQDLSINVNGTAESFTYVAPIESNSLVPTGSSITGNFVVQSGSETFDIPTSGTNDGAKLINLAQSINSTSGADAIRAKVVTDSTTGNVSLHVWSVDPTKKLEIDNSSGANAQIMSAAVTRSAGANNFNSLLTLKQAINNSAAQVDVSISRDGGKSVLRVAPQVSGATVDFGGANNVIKAPLGDGSSTSIAEALGLNNLPNADDAVRGLNNTLQIQWADIIGTAPNEIQWDFEDKGLLRQVSQTPSAIIERNGATTGELRDIQVDEKGLVTAIFTNGEQKGMYKLAIGDVANANGLTPDSGGIFKTSIDSGPLMLKSAGQDGASLVEPGSLESSNIDVATELSGIIQAKARYQASSKALNISNQMLEELVNRTFG